MDKGRPGCIVSGLNRYELTGLETRFVQSVGQYFKENSILTDQQESILEDIYREKTGLIRNAVFSILGEYWWIELKDADGNLVNTTAIEGRK